MNLRFKCLILDHDDTAVDSSARIHYPAHREAMRKIRPGIEPVDLDGWFLKNFHPGLMAYLTEELGLSERELEAEYRIWRSFTMSRLPSFFPGFLETLAEYRARGGIITVVSHSEEDIIRWHYGEFRPDMILGWTDEEARRKPSPWPVERILRVFGLEAGEVLIVDDLKPGVLMSRAAGVPVAAAGWAHNIPEIRAYMQASCIAYLETIQELKEFIL